MIGRSMSSFRTCSTRLPERLSFISDARLHFMKLEVLRRPSVDVDVLATSYLKLNQPVTLTFASRI